MQFEVRRATVEDLEGVVACLQLAFEPYREAYTPGGFADTVLTGEAFLKRLETMVVLVASGEGRIVGTIGYAVTGGEGHLRGMAVLPEARGTGVAQALLDAAESGMAAAGAGTATLDTTRPLERAIHFYERNGYRATGEVEDFFGMELLAYSKRLSV